MTSNISTNTRNATSTKQNSSNSDTGRLDSQSKHRITFHNAKKKPKSQQSNGRAATSSEEATTSKVAKKQFSFSNLWHSSRSKPKARQVTSSLCQSDFQTPTTDKRTSNDTSNTTITFHHPKNNRLDNPTSK